MFRGKVLGVWYYSWNSYKNAYNKAVVDFRRISPWGNIE